MEALALRWLLHHSALQPEDGIIFGASSPKQAEQTIEIAKAGSLSLDAAEKLSKLWEICSEDAESIVTY